MLSCADVICHGSIALHFGSMATNVSQTPFAKLIDPLCVRDCEWACVSSRDRESVPTFALHCRLRNKSHLHC